MKIQSGNVKDKSRSKSPRQSAGGSKPVSSAKRREAPREIWIGYWPGHRVAFTTGWATDPTQFEPPLRTVHYVLSRETNRDRRNRRKP